jgi:hypothetical protein
MTRARALLQVLANPNLAFIFLSLGTLAILYEIANPGLGLGGIAGVVMLILALFSLAVLPVNYAGAALLLPSPWRCSSRSCSHPAWAWARRAAPRRWCSAGCSCSRPRPASASTCGCSCPPRP